MSNILTFPGGKAAPRAVGNPSFDYSRPTPQPLPKRTRLSPYRQNWRYAEVAFVELSKVDHAHTEEEIAYVRRGVEAAQLLAKDMTAAAEKLLSKQRQTNTLAMARKREFKTAMRQRIKDVAASRDLPDDEIRSAMTCKHQAIGVFAKKHGVNLEWLIAGKGRIFKKDPIVLGPNMTGSEFAAVVATMPQAKQEMIRAMVDQILEERGL
jgi:hypothetical protein